MFDTVTQNKSTAPVDFLRMPLVQQVCLSSLQREKTAFSDGPSQGNKNAQEQDHISDNIVAQ